MANKALGCLVTLLLFLGVVGGLVYVFVFRPQQLEDLLGGLEDLWNSLDDYHNEDPFNSTTPEDSDRWKNDGNGLQLELLNALESDWYSYFDLAVSDWDAGTPDVLTLTTSIVPHEVDCEPVSGKMKVCNGNYGDTQWRGLNTVLVTNGIILSSVAQMNEFYLERANDEQKQYTMCHEIGHGFGLPHTDEDFFNKDQGNCLDYTNNPAANMHPDESNFEFLAEMYGTISSSSNRNRRRNMQQQRQQEMEHHADNAKHTAAAPPTIPYWVRSKWQAIRTAERSEQQHQQRRLRNGKWRLLQQNSHSIAHEIDIGSGYSIRTFKLLAFDD